MTDNHISYDEELEEIEAKLKELSKIYQDEYEENGKYFKPHNPKLILWFFYLPCNYYTSIKKSIQFNLLWNKLNSISDCLYFLLSLNL